MMSTDYMKPLSQQLDTVLPQLVKHDEAIDKSLPFYLAVIAKTAGKSPEEFFGYNMKALELIFGSDKAGKSPTELADAEYAYLVNAKAREIFDTLTKAKL